MSARLDVELLTEIRDAILAEPRQFDMLNFLRLDGDCKTTACIAGHAALLRGWRPLKEYGAVKIRLVNLVRKEKEYQDIEDVARKELGIGKKESDKLFYAANWPDFYFRKWVIADNAEEAIIACRLIQTIIDNDGRIWW